MKKVSFSFLCNEDPMQMPVNPGKKNSTRHCGQCAKNIVDFTGMNAQQIAQHLRTAAKPCGFMLPWQLDELNRHLEQESPGIITKRLKKPLAISLAKMAAMVSSPFVFQQAAAQTTGTVMTENHQQQTGKPRTEVLVNSVTGSPLCHIEIEITGSSGARIALIKTDSFGKIYLDPELKAHGALTLQNKALGISKTVTLTGEAVCLVWETRVEAPVAEPELAYDFSFTLNSDNSSRKIARTKVEITMYDSLNNPVGSLNDRTDSKGRLELRDIHLKQAAYVTFRFDTKNGIKTAYATLKHMDPVKTNELVIEDYDRFMMGIMVE